MTDHTLTVTLNLDTEQLAAELRETLRRHIAAALVADRYAANEAKQREAEPDPLDEDDHRDRLTGSGYRLQRRAVGCWHTKLASYWHPACDLTLDYWADQNGPLTFAPEAPQEATGGDLSASEGESGAEEGGEADEAVEPLLCVECGHDIGRHLTAFGCLDPFDDPCDCDLSVSDVARALIERAGIEAVVRVDAEFSRLLAVSTDPTAALRRAAMMEAVGVTDDQAKWFAQILAKGRLLPSDLQRLKAAVEQTGGRRG